MEEYLKHNKNDKHVHGSYNLGNHDKCNKTELSKSKNKKALGLILIVTFSFAFVEMFGGIWSNSLALIADSFHMLTDSFSIFIALIMVHISQKPANTDFTYGHGRSEVIGALINGFLMVCIILFLIYKGINRLIAPEEVKSLGIIIIASGGLLVNIFAIYILKDSHSLNSKAALLHILGDFLGSIAALVAGIIIYFTNLTIFDPIISLLVAFILIWPTYQIIKQSIRVLMEGVPENINYKEVGNSIKNIKGVITLHDLHIWSMTSYNGALSAHIQINKIEEWPEILENIQGMLSSKYYIDHVTLQPEIIFKEEIVKEFKEIKDYISRVD